MAERARACRRLCRGISALGILVALLEPAAGTDRGTSGWVPRGSYPTPRRTAPAARSRTPVVDEEITAKIDLPDLPLRRTPLDARLRVGLYIPRDLGTANPQVLSAPIEDDGVPKSNLVIIDLAAAVEKALPRVVDSFFPNTTRRHSDDPAGDELLLTTELVPTIIKADDHFAGLEVRVRLKLMDASGRLLDTVDGEHAAQPERQVYWSTRTKSEFIGALALGPALAQLARHLEASAPLTAFLQARREASAQPPRLDLAAEFDDAGELIPNRALDAGERGRVRVELTNEGPGPAYEVSLDVDSSCPQVKPSGKVALGTLAAGERKQTELAIAAGLDLADSVCRLRLTAVEKRGYGSRPLALEIAARAVRPTSLEIVDVVLNDGGGRAHGDGDGQPANGETVEALVRLRNAGPGAVTAVTVTAKVTPQSGVEVLEPSVVVAGMPVQQVREARLMLRLPLTYQSTALAVTFEAVDSRGPGVARATFPATWSVHLKRPALQGSYRVLDGNSAASTGNRDGVVNNGERVELAVTAHNRGEIQAKDVLLRLAADGPGLVPQPAALGAGNLPPHAEGAEHRFLIDVPRSFGHDDRTLTELDLVLTLSQEDFPAARQPLSLPFRFQQPNLAADVPNSLTLVRGAPAFLLPVQLRNDGELAAEEVVVEVSTGNPALDILDGRNVPDSKRRFAIGTLAAGAEQQLRIPLLAKQSAALSSSDLTLTVAQRDFPPVARSVKLRVTEGDIRVIPPHAPVPEPVAAPLAGVLTPAAISFLRYGNGDRVTAEKVVLQFEVQAATEPSEVRVSQNDRLLPLAGPLRAAAAHLEVLKYQLTVQLAPGENYFNVVVVSREGVRSERSLSLIRDWQQGRLWLVAIGVGRYADATVRELQFANADATAVHQYFRDTFGLPESQAVLRTDRQATLREIKSLLGTQLAARANNPDDTVIIYFAGHGIAEPGAGSADADGLSKYLLPHDAELDDLYSTALDMDEIVTIIRRLAPERVVIIIDSCFSGEAGERSPVRRRNNLTGEFLDRIARLGQGRVVLAASKPNEPAEEHVDLGHGVFTHYLLKGLRGEADGDHDGEIDLDELYTYVAKRVPPATRDKQHPQRRGDQVGRIVVGRSTATAGVPAGN